jgi:hypothetical protein
MGKRSDFERIPRDYYRTWDPRAAAALAPHLEPHTRYVEPCAGAGDLIATLAAWGHDCIAACDIEPQAGGIQVGDARKIKRLPPGADMFITNPPWAIPLLHEIVMHLSAIGPLWALFYSDWAFTEQAGPILRERCTDIVVIGRLKWIPGTTDDPKDNCSWYRFAPWGGGRPVFHNGRGLGS